MRAWLAAIIGLGCLAATGCGGHAKYATMALEEENRQLEDMIYQQQAELERAHQALEACRRASPSGPPPGAGAAAPPPAAAAAPKPGAPDLSRPPVMVEMPSAPSSQIPDTLKDTEAPRYQEPAGEPSPLNDAPTLQLPAGPEGVPGLQMPGPLPPNGNAPQPLRKSSPQRVPATSPQSTSRENRASSASSQVVEITLNDALTGGCQTVPGRGDKGISLLLEPRDEEGRLIPAPAPVSVVVLDPALQGPAARVARWDFSAEQLAPLYRQASTGEGFHLEMHWPSAPPVHEDLQLFVRYVTKDGRRVETQRRIRVAVAGSASRDQTADRRQPAPRGPNGEPGWQQRPASSEPAEPVRLSSRPVTVEPRAASVAPTPPAESAPPKLARPAWSPERR